MKPEQDAVLEALYRAHFHQLEVHAYRFLGSWEDAHVAAQETFHIACEKIDVLMASPNQVGWLKNTVKYVCQNMRRSRQRQLLLFSSLEELGDGDLPAAADEPGGDPMEPFRGLLSEEELRLLQAIVLDGVSYAEAAKALGINLWACRKRVQRAMDRLRQKYRENFGEDFSP